jgi:hypothetical protein
MKWILSALLLFVSCSPGTENNQPSSSQITEAGRVSFADGKVSFVPPSGFQKLTPEQVARKFPQSNDSRHLFANDTQSVSAGVTFSPAKVSPNKLQELKETFEEMLPKMSPGLQWQTRDFVEINGVKWVHLKFLSKAIDTDIQNDMFITSFEGRALIFAFNSISREYEAVKASLDESKNSIVIKQ